MFEFQDVEPPSTNVGCQVFKILFVTKMLTEGLRKASEKGFMWVMKFRFDVSDNIKSSLSDFNAEPSGIEYV